jgi:HPt (histidine-containing phosphotransfer) domain-containing protein
MDHMMPEMDGVEAARIIREEIGTEYAKNVPIIALTANAIAGNEEMFLSKGFQAFLSKPIEIDRLDMIIRQWVRDKEQEELYFEHQKEASSKQVSDFINCQRDSAPRRSGIDRRSLNKGITGLDMAQGLERFGGEEDIYLNVLHSYVKNTPHLLESIKGVTGDNLADYAIAVHGIKGSSQGICADEFADIAETLEKAAKAGDYDFIAANNGSFLDAAWRLVSEIDNMLTKTYLLNPKPKKEKPDRDILAKLLEACRNYDMDMIDAAMAELTEYEYETDREFVPWLSENIQQFDLAKIIEKLSALLN